MSDQKLPTELVEVHPDGTLTRHPLSPEESARMDAEFWKVFDPETLELRSLQKLRKLAAERHRGEL